MSTALDTEKHQLKLEIGMLQFDSNPDVIQLLSMDQDGDKKWKTVGTAFPLFHNSILYIITAAHVVKGLVGKPLYAIHDKRNVSLATASILKQDEFDIAVIRCNSEILTQIFSPCRCINPDLKAFTCNDSGEEAIYQVYGFPQSKNKISKTQPIIQKMFRMTLGRAHTLPQKTKLAATGVPLLCFNADPNDLVDEKFEKTSQLGKFEGMSGGPVIRHNIKENDTAGKIVGMFVEWHSAEKTAIAVPIAVITAWIDINCAQ